MPTLVGRDREAAELTRELAGAALVTLVGPGGVGKTTLAAAVAGSAAWCDLAALAPGPAVREAVHQARGGAALVVLDNCEHVLEDAAAVTAELVRGGARVLATSRESLGVRGEHVVALGPLALPATDDLEAVRASDAARLFVARAAAAGGGFVLDDGNAADVARLCRRLDGLPLALELSAARARALTPREIADRLDLALLTRRKATEARHRSLTAAIDWSYELLSEAERTLFDRLGVFSTAVPLADVEAICGDGALDVLDSLVDRSLVVARQGAGETRYGMLETLRAYARERLAERDELEPLRERHADVYAERAGALTRISDADEPLVALRRCVERDATPARAFKLLAPAWAIVHSRRAAEVTALAERALARWPDAPGVADVLAVAATGHFVLGDPARARARALAAPEALVARRALALTTYHFDRDLVAADRLLAEVVTAARAEHAGWIAPEMTALRALVVAARGNPDEGLALARRARREAERDGLDLIAAWAIYVRGAIELRWREPPQATVRLEQALALARELDFPFVLGASLRQLGVAAALAGDHDLAAERLTTALRHFQAAGDLVLLCEALRSTAIALAARGDAEAARRLLAGVAAVPGARLLAPIDRGLLERVLPGGEPQPVSSVGLDALARTALATLARRSAHAGAVFRREGSHWTLAYGGRSAQLVHRKGLADIAVLLARPGEAVHCLDLAGDGRGHGDLGELADRPARDAYRERVDELREEIDAARRANDPEREQRLRDELAAIAEQLEAAYGLGGRVRRSGDPAERARTTVAWRIRSALQKLEGEHAALARHLRNAVRTGTWCVYEPEVPVPWAL